MWVDLGGLSEDLLVHKQNIMCTRQLFENVSNVMCENAKALA